MKEREMKIMSLMKRTLVLFFVFTGMAIAAEKTVILKVDNMTCASCPYMVKSALKKVNGVNDTKVSLQTKLAVVKFDDSTTSIEALIAATFNAGFPSALNSSSALKMGQK